MRFMPDGYDVPASGAVHATPNGVLDFSARTILECTGSVLRRVTCMPPGESDHFPEKRFGWMGLLMRYVHVGAWSKLLLSDLDILRVLRISKERCFNVGGRKLRPVLSERVWTVHPA